MLKTIILIFFLGLAGIVAFYFLEPDQTNQEEAAATSSDQLFGWKYPVVKFPTTGPGQLTYSDIRDPGGIPEGLPVRLKIPIIGVDSAIEDALITPDGKMDVPAGSRNVAWFALGPNPGEVGSAVIGGHFGITNGIKFVFYDLDKLKVGDKIYIEDDRGKTLAFQVKRIELFERDADATTVFTSNDGLSHLNLITCEGLWNRVNDTYPQRRVVFTDAIPGEGAPPESVIRNTTFTRSLSVGAQGADVVSLQIALEQKGFLTMPPGVPRGLFGSLTRAAVVKYQSTVGLPQVGIFGPLTRAKLSSELIDEGPSFPSTATTAESEPTSSSNRLIKLPVYIQTITQSAKSLFGTPIDGIVTSLLLILIIFASFKIIKR